VYKLLANRCRPKYELLRNYRIVPIWNVVCAELSLSIIILSIASSQDYKFGAVHDCICI